MIDPVCVSNRLSFLLDMVFAHCAVHTVWQTVEKHAASSASLSPMKQKNAVHYPATSATISRLGCKLQCNAAGIFGGLPASSPLSSKKGPVSTPAQPDFQSPTGLYGKTLQSAWPPRSFVQTGSQLTWKSSEHAWFRAMSQSVLEMYSYR